MERSERFRHIEDSLERWRVPRVFIGHRKAYLVLKVLDVREFLHFVAPDLLYDTVISERRIKALEDDQWELEVMKFDAELLALWRVGLLTKAETKLVEARALYEKVLEKILEELRAREGRVQDEKKY
jgi:hypothetical protein